ncbi:DUF4178 domain-containing protein [Zavarzinia sp. CC-PAN008]|uniref:DUF4178 domain-containing protein n=1 Tax=Zavarzinia sp. CC-PAN008 TaxID=3243332 RepID=UPI003F74570D
MTAAREVSCPSCGGAIAIKAAGYSITVACQYCGSILDVADPDVRLIREYHLAVMDLPLVLGSRGELSGVEWEVVGALERTDGDVTWLEFLLFNPYAGYRWLILADGDWQFGEALVEVPETGRDRATWRGRHYEQDYDPARTETRRVVGEFYWRVQAGDAVMACTYSHGDQVLSREVSQDEVNWSVFSPIPERAIAAAFPGFDAGRGAAFQGDGGAGAGALASGNIVGYFVTGAMAAGLVFILGSALHDFSPAVTNRTYVPIDRPGVELSIGRITVERSSAAVAITASSPDFANKWVDLDYRLVNEATEQAITGYDVLEYYVGRDWSEGSRSSTARLSAVPRGTYEVLVDASAHSWAEGSYSGQFTDPRLSGPNVMDVRFEVERDAWFWENDLVAMLLIFAWPALALYGQRKGARR